MNASSPGRHHILYEQNPRAHRVCKETISSDLFNVAPQAGPTFLERRPLLLSLEQATEGGPRPQAWGQVASDKGPGLRVS